MKISVIVSTYNQPEWLRKTLWGYACQARRADEILIADDGSGEATREEISAIAAETGLPLRHVWHADRGFRKTEILNKALAESTGDYLIFTDGDCIPRRDFVATHERLAKPGRFLSSGAVRLSMPASRAIRKVDVDNGKCFRVSWLRCRWRAPGDKRPAPALLKLRCRGPWGDACSWLTTTRATWNGNNASCYRADALAVRGFDERMQYGGEDREFGERLVNHGLRGWPARFSAICVHLDHGRGYVEPEMITRNLAIRAETKRLRRVETDHGLGRQAA